MRFFGIIAALSAIIFLTVYVCSGYSVFADSLDGDSAPAWVAEYDALIEADIAQNQGFSTLGYTFGNSMVVDGVTFNLAFAIMRSSSNTQEIYYYFIASGATFAINNSAGNADYNVSSSDYVVLSKWWYTSGSHSSANITSAGHNTNTFAAYFSDPVWGVNGFAGKSDTSASYFYVKYFLAPDVSNVDFALSSLGFSDFDVLVSPDLGLNMTAESMSQGGWDADYFDIIIDNNSDSQWYQIMWEIVDSSGLTVFRDNGEEWCYKDTKGAVIDETSFFRALGNVFEYIGEPTIPNYFREHTLTYAYGHTKWHSLGYNAAYECGVQWDDINLVSQAVYTLNVYAIQTEFMVATEFINIADGFSNEIANSDSGDYVWETYAEECYNVDISGTPECIYSQQFSLSSAPSYNPENTNYYIGNSSSYTPDFTNDDFSVYQDLDTGAVKNVGDVDYSVDFDFGDYNVTDMQGLFSSTEGFLGFLGSVFSILPSFMWVIIAGGLTGVVILRILGR